MASKFRRLSAAIGLALMATISAPAAMAWAAPYPPATEINEPELPEEELTPPEETNELEGEIVEVRLDSEQFAAIMIASALLLMMVTVSMVVLWRL